MKRSAVDWILPLFLATLVLALYAQTLSFGFLKLDDQLYIKNLSWVREGPTLSGIHQAFTRPVGNIYMPLVLVSFMVDAGLYGLWPGGFHLTNALFHMANVLLLFFVFKRLSGKVGPSAMAAVLLAIHPLHVESVAWIAERKDVLSAFFCLLTLWAYERWVRSSSRAAYLSALAFFLLALLSKPMAVSLPLGLLALDYWPLGRMSASEYPGTIELRRFFSLIWEKIPLVILAGLFSLVAMFVTADQNTTIDWGILPLSVRLENAVVSYAAYLEKLIVPTNLAVLYPHLGSAIPITAVAVSALVLIAILWIAIRIRRRAPWILMGVSWYLITLLPVIGLIQVGPQAMADRFVYIPFWGIYWAIGWTAMVLVDQGLVGRKTLGAAGIVVLVIFFVVSWRQIGYWRDELTLFTHAAQVTKDNWRMENNVAAILIEKGDLDGARQHLALAFRASPNEAMTQYNLGILYKKNGQDRLAEYHLKRAIRLNPEYPRSHLNLGLIMAQRGEWDRAINELETALKQDGPSVDLNIILGKIYAVVGKSDLAAIRYRDALRLDPENKFALRELKKLGIKVHDE